MPGVLVLVLLAMLAGMSDAVLAATAGPDKPDVLFIAIDDMNDWTTLFDPRNPIQTPNLKRLAERGTFFERAYCAAPACCPSRAAVMTGLRPTSSGVYGNNDAWAKIVPPNRLTIPQAFAQAGYLTRGGGKIFHHGPAGADRPDNPSFQEFFPLHLHSFAPEHNHNGYLPIDEPYLAKADWDWGPHDVPKQDDEYTVDYAVNVLKTRPADQPLFLAVGIFRPHLPFWAPSSYFEKYPLGTLQTPPMPVGDLNDVPPIGRDFAHTEHFIFSHASPKEPVDPGSLFRMIQAYEAASTYADAMVGRLLDALDATGRADRTIIVLWSDHGYHLGDKESCVKFTLWEKATRVPLIVVAPNQPGRGRRCDTPVGLIDLFPTLLDLAGVPDAQPLDGQSLVPLLHDPQQPWNRPALMTWGRGNHAIRSKQWRFIHYRGGGEELYDEANDPWEWTNLVKDPSLADVLAEHRKWLPTTEAAEPKNE